MKGSRTAGPKPGAWVYQLSSPEMGTHGPDRVVHSDACACVDFWCCSCCAFSGAFVHGQVGAGRCRPGQAGEVGSRRGQGGLQVVVWSQAVAVAATIATSSCRDPQRVVGFASWRHSRVRSAQVRICHDQAAAPAPPAAPAPAATTPARLARRGMGRRPILPWRAPVPPSQRAGFFRASLSPTGGATQQGVVSFGDFGPKFPTPHCLRRDAPTLFAHRLWLAPARVEASEDAPEASSGLCAPRPGCAHHWRFGS